MNHRSLLFLLQTRIVIGKETEIESCLLRQVMGTIMIENEVKIPISIAHPHEHAHLLTTIDSVEDHRLGVLPAARPVMAHLDERHRAVEKRTIQEVRVRVVYPWFTLDQETEMIRFQTDVENQVHHLNHPTRLFLLEEHHHVSLAIQYFRLRLIFFFTKLTLLRSSINLI